MHRARTTTRIQEKLDDAEFAETCEQCKELTLDEAVGLSLGEVEPDT